VGEIDWGVRLTTHLYVRQRLRMTRATPILSIYAFISWTGANLPSVLQIMVFVHAVVVRFLIKLQ
jgi:hypothetical protein